MQNSQRRTRIVCTIGPSSHSDDRVRQLITHGMDVARINFSHGGRDTHTLMISTLRRVAEEQGVQIPILMDLQGPKIRVGIMQDGVQTLQDGSMVTLTPADVVGTASEIPIDYPQLAADVMPGNTILMDDGLLELRIESVSDGVINARVIIGGLLKSRKGVNLPDVRTSVSAITAKDLEDLAYGVSAGVDFVAMSFVRHSRDVAELRQHMQNLGSSAALIAKIEKPEALDEIDAIIDVADGIMIARGDLGIEIASERVPLIQKDIIERCRRAGKPVITATQMLESMIEHPRPTRAESSDVANAVLDGTDAVMLSGESAVGKYPLEAVIAMDKICRNVELKAERIYYGLKYMKPARTEKQIIESLSYACVVMAHDIGARAIATITHSGSTARRIAKYRPGMPVIAFIESDQVLRQLNLVWGVTSIKLEELFDTDRSVKLMENYLKSRGMVQRGDRIVLATGIPIAKRGRTNMVTIATIS